MPNNAVYYFLSHSFVESKSTGQSAVWKSLKIIQNLKWHGTKSITKRTNKSATLPKGHKKQRPVENTVQTITQGWCCLTILAYSIKCSVVYLFKTRNSESTSHLINTLKAYVNLELTPINCTSIHILFCTTIQFT